MPFRRTFAPVILTFTHSTETSLLHPGSVQFPTPLNWHGHRPSPKVFRRSRLKDSILSPATHSPAALGRVANGFPLGVR